MTVYQCYSKLQNIVHVKLLCTEFKTPTLRNIVIKHQNLAVVKVLPPPWGKKWCQNPHPRAKDAHKNSLPHTAHPPAPSPVQNIDRCINDR